MVFIALLVALAALNAVPVIGTIRLSADVQTEVARCRADLP